MTEYRDLGDDELVEKDDVYVHDNGSVHEAMLFEIGRKAGSFLYNRWKRKIEPTPVVVSEVESGLKAIDNRLEEVNRILQEMTNLLNRIAPLGSERERIALQSFLHCGGNPQEGFRSADWFLEERDKQRATERAER